MANEESTFRLVHIGKVRESILAVAAKAKELGLVLLSNRSFGVRCGIDPITLQEYWVEPVEILIGGKKTSPCN